MIASEWDAMVIRDLRQEDLDRMAELEQICFAVPWTRDMLAEELRNPDARYVTVWSGAEMFGYGGYWRIIDEAHVTNVAIAPAWRGRGFGEALMRALIGRAVAEGLTAMTLEVRQGNEVAKALYAKLGFVAIGVRPRYYPDGENALILWKRDMPEGITNS